MVAFLSAPRIKNIAMSAVALSTAPGVLDILIQRSVHADTSMLSYPAPL